MSWLCDLLRGRRDPTDSEATQARVKAEADLEAIKAETPKYRALAQSLVAIQRANHLGESAARILRGDK